MAGVQYLESLDSVRSGTPDDPTYEVAKLQVLLEAVLTLALGRQVAVPYSYAFDSPTFLSVAEMVLTARPEQTSDRRDRPFRIWLHGFPSFDAAVQDMLARAADEANPFWSSAHPALRWRDDHERRALPATVTDLESRTWAGEALQKVRDEFSRAQTHLARGREIRSKSLAEMVGELLAPGADDARPAEDDDLRPAYDRLIAAVRELSPTGFGQRSRLRRTDLPWPGDAEGRPAAAIVDDAGLDLLREFVDTYYNRVVFESMGQGEATFSTGAVRGSGTAAAQLLAQRLALGSSRPARAADIARERPVFDLLAGSPEFDSESAMGRLATRINTAGHTALRPLLAQRAEGPGSPFWTGVRKVEDAAAAGDGTAFRKALDAHFAVVSKALPTDVRFRVATRQDVSAAASITGATTPGAAELMWGLPGGLTLGLTFIGAALPYVLQGAEHLRHRRAQVSIAHALGDYVTGSPRG